MNLSNLCVENRFEGKRSNQAEQLGSYFHSPGRRYWWGVATVEVVRNVKFYMYFDVRIKRIS